MPNFYRVAALVSEPAIHHRFDDLLPGRAGLLGAERGLVLLRVVARIVGQVDFVAPAPFGKVGRACLAQVRIRQYQIGGSTQLQRHIIEPPRWFIELLRECPPRTIDVCAGRGAPVMLFTDGVAKMGDDWFARAGVTDEPSRELRVGVVVIYDPIACRLEDRSFDVPRVGLQKWLPQRQHVALVDLYVYGSHGHRHMQPRRRRPLTSDLRRRAPPCIQSRKATRPRSTAR